MLTKIKNRADEALSLVDAGFGRKWAVISEIYGY